jgi:hypothetical protein
MPTIVDDIELDETNIEFNNASDLVTHTSRLIYLTGKAGTGKTTFLKYLKQTTDKNTVILAPTGVASINAGGQTIHSFFQIKPSIYVPNDIRLRTRADISDSDKSTIYDHFKYFKERLEIIRGMQLLIIDEISMVRCDLLDVIDRLLRVYRKRESEAFGGVQVILIGDTFQLPPIAEFEQWEILNQFYESPFFFSSKVVKENKPIYIELKKIYRQNEQEFIELLNKIRINQVSQNDLAVLNNKLNPTFSPSGNTNYITLATHNKIVDSTNSIKLSELTTELKLFEATITGTFPDNIIPTNRVLELKENAQVMFIKNNRQKKYYNGKIATIKSIVGNEIIVEFSEGNEIAVARETWNNIKYLWNDENKKIEEEIIGTFTQFPLKLAWAISVHKSQGLTFERVIADLGSAFSSGQVYVALSRCTSFSGLVLKTRIDRSAIITDPRVLNFAQNETPSTLIVQELNFGKADFYYKKAREAIKSYNFSLAIDNLINAIKYRNDIETELFRRYIIIICSRWVYYKDQLEKQVIENKNTKDSKLALEIMSKEFINENAELQTKTNEQNSAIKLLLRKVKEFEDINTKSEQQILELKKELQEVNGTLSSFQKKTSFQESKIKELEKTVVGQENEITRLRNLKWHEKLFGSK